MGVDVGWMVWSRTRGHAGVDDAGDQMAPIGGVVVDVVTNVDDHGEVAQTFVVVEVNRGRLRLRRIPEADIDGTTSQRATGRQLSGVIRLLCEDVALTDQRRRRTGDLTPEQFAELIYAWRLGGLVAA